MKVFTPFMIVLFFFIASSQAQSPVLQWQKCYGGTDEDFTRSLELTNDGGFIFCASAESVDGDVTGNHGPADFWLVKANASGDIQWQKCLGGSLEDYGWDVKQTADGGYVLTGFSDSDDGDVSGNHGNYDYWVVKTDASGNIQWQKTLGGSAYDAPYAIEQTRDHGYVIAGTVKSNDGDVTGGFGIKDAWIVKLDSTGNIQWEKVMGGSGVDDAFAIKQTSDGGYIVAGNSSSMNGDVSGGHGSDDYWVVKMNAAGSIQWQHCYGGTASEVSRYVEQTKDGGYVVIGFSLSNDGDVTGNHGLNDIWVIKIDESGILQWQKCFGGSADDYGRKIEQTGDGGYLIVGPSGSSDGDVTGNHGKLDYWIAKLDISQNIEWQKSLGGTLKDYVYTFQTDDAGNYFLGGYTESNDGDVTGNHGNQDVWIVKLSSPETCSTPTNLSTTKITSTSALLKWQIVGAPTGFTIRYKLTSSSNWLYKNSNGTKNSFRLNGLISSSQYEWSISANCGTQSSAYSESKLFTTLSLKGEKNTTTDQASLHVYPNPSNGIFTLEMSGVINDKVFIEVIDLLGKIVVEEIVSTNDKMILYKMNLKDLKSGPYIIRIIYNGDVYTRSIRIVE